MRSADDTGYQALAEFRYRIRLFLNATDEAVRAAGLEPEQYQLLLAVRGIPRNRTATIGVLAERLQVRHNTAVERIDRLEKLHLLRRVHNPEDRREVIVDFTPRGEQTFEKLARLRLRELRRSGPALVQVLSTVVEAARDHKSLGNPSHRRRKGA